MKNKILALLGFASKSGNLSFGFAASLESLKQKKSRLIVCGFDVSPKTLKEITFHAQKIGIDALSLKDTDIYELSNSVGHKCGVISVNDIGFAKSLKEEILNDQ